MENRINNSSIFTIEKETDFSLYQSTLYSFVEDIYHYVCLLSSKYSEMGLEIVETTNSCLKTYDPNKGLFTHYFLASIAHMVAKNNSERVNTVDYSIDDEKIDFLASLSAEDYPTPYGNLVVMDELAKINAAFQKYSDASKPIISMLLTTRILNEIPELIITNNMTYDFIDRTLLSLYINTSKIFTSREIAAFVGRNESSLSRSYRRFIRFMEKKTQ